MHYRLLGFVEQELGYNDMSNDTQVLHAVVVAMGVREACTGIFD